MASPAEPIGDKRTNPSSKRSLEELAEFHAGMEEGHARGRIRTAKIAAEAKRRGIDYGEVEAEIRNKSAEQFAALNARIASGEFTFWDAVERLVKLGSNRFHVTDRVRELMGLRPDEDLPDPKERPSGIGV